MLEFFLIKFFKEYLHLLEKEIKFVNPKVIILVGNQVSSIVLDKKYLFLFVEKKKFIKTIDNKDFEFYSVYYPVGNGRFNIDKSIEEIKWILNSMK